MTFFDNRIGVARTATADRRASEAGRVGDARAETPLLSLWERQGEGEVTIGPPLAKGSYRGDACVAPAGMSGRVGRWL
jgi:hypothetical protein